MEGRGVTPPGLPTECKVTWGGPGRGGGGGGGGWGGGGGVGLEGWWGWERGGAWREIGAEGLNVKGKRDE